MSFTGLRKSLKTEDRLIRNVKIIIVPSEVRPYVNHGYMELWLKTAKNKPKKLLKSFCTVYKYLYINMISHINVLKQNLSPASPSSTDLSNLHIYTISDLSNMWYISLLVLLDHNAKGNKLWTWRELILVSFESAMIIFVPSFPFSPFPSHVLYYRTTS